MNPEVPQTPAELIVVPESIQVAVDTQRAAAEQAASDNAADAARRIISEVPGYETQLVQDVPAPAEGDYRGKFGRGVVEAVMPADPSHVVGWTGEVKR